MKKCFTLSLIVSLFGLGITSCDLPNTIPASVGTDPSGPTITTPLDPVPDPTPAVKFYTINGTYTADVAASPDSLSISDTILVYNGTTYQILSDSVWSTATDGTSPLRVAYLVKQGDDKYLCSVWYYVNNGKDYVKFNLPAASTLDSCPESYDYTDPSCTTGKLGKALVQSLTWSVTLGSGSNTVKVEKVPGKVQVTAGGKTWDVGFKTWVKNMDLSMPVSEGRMEMHVDEGLWFASQSKTPNLQPIVYPVQDPMYYELQCCNSYGMYLLSVTKAVYSEDDDDEPCVENEIVANLILTESEYNSLMVHYR